MSITSQKSFNDDLNEIFERGHSIKSVSEQSLSCDEDDDENLSHDLLKKLTPAVLNKLRKCFKKAKEKRARDLDKKVEEVMRVAAAEEGIEFPVRVHTNEEQVYLNENGFVTALDSILGKHKYTPHARTLYRALDRFHTGRVSWSQLVSRLLASGATATASRLDTWRPVTCGGIVKLDHCHRETLVTLVSVERDDSFCYVAVSRGGRVGVYAGDMNIIRSYEVFYHRSGVRRRVRNCWITDAVYMSDVSCIVFSASDRSLTIYDVSTITHTPLYCITGLPNIPTCLAYSPASHAGAASQLVLGTERGDVTCIYFLQPRLSLLHVKAPDTINYYFWMELSSPPHTSYCSVRSWRGHSRSVRRVSCERDGAVVLSCSHDGSVSVRLKYLVGTLDDYMVTVHRGVSCFDSVPSLRIFATGSKDGAVRLYTHTQSSPHAVLSTGAGTSLVDVKILPAESVVLGYCSRCYVYIWDLYEECLLQTVKIKFPFLGVLGKRVEFGTNCIHLGPPRKQVQKGEPEDVIRSRRGSSVYEGSTGGLILQLESETDLEQSSCYERTEILITCSDSVFTLRVRESGASVVPPAGRAGAGARPALWDPMPLDTGTGIKASVTPSLRTLTASPALHVPAAMLYTHTHDLDQLINNAGLEDILEKNFVLMRGLKHDLNKKLFEMESNMDTRKSAVNACAPYLALARYELDPLPTFDRLYQRYSATRTYFPGPSVNVTPTGSESTTPRNKTSLQ